MALSKRLSTILEMLEPCEVLADIGTDHGFIPIEAVRKGLCRRAIACDVGRGPLERAAGHIAEAGLSDVIETRLGDGLHPLEAGEADRIVIAGMGGPLMARLLSECAETAAGADGLILGPQSELDVFRGSLLQRFDIRRERMVEEDGKFYFLIDAAARGAGADMPHYTGGELLYGRADLFDEESLEVRARLLARDLEVCRQILRGLVGSSSEAAEARRREIQDRIRVIGDLTGRKI